MSVSARSPGPERPPGRLGTAGVAAFGVVSGMYSLLTVNAIDTAAETGKVLVSISLLILTVPVLSWLRRRVRLVGRRSWRDWREVTAAVLVVGFAVSAGLLSWNVITHAVPDPDDLRAARVQLEDLGNDWVEVPVQRSRHVLDGLELCRAVATAEPGVTVSNGFTGGRKSIVNSLPKGHLDVRSSVTVLASVQIARRVVTAATELATRCKERGRTRDPAEQTVHFVDQETDDTAVRILGEGPAGAHTDHAIIRVGRLVARISYQVTPDPAVSDDQHADPKMIDDLSEDVTRRLHQVPQ